MARTRGGGKKVPTRRSSRLMNKTGEQAGTSRSVRCPPDSDNHQLILAIREDSDTERVAIPPEVETEAEADCVAVTPLKNRKWKTVDVTEEDGEAVSGDDCVVAGDEDCNEVGYAEEGHHEEMHTEEQWSIVPVPERYDGGDGVDENDEGVGVDENDEGGGDGVDENDGGVGVEEQHCDDFEAEFGEEARENNNGGESEDSGDEIWDDERIPEPLSDSDEEEDPEGEGGAPQEGESHNELLRLGKTFNGPEDFKIACLRYSLKTRYDIKLYKSQSLRIGAKCSATDVKCSWRCYCSYDKKKHKMQVKIYEDKHACVRSGYSKMLKVGAIAWLFEERLRKNPKLTKKDMVAEITREYNLTVTEDQCAKAKTKIMKRKKASHEDHFSRIWDYQAEIF